ncbi:GNAT family N-acetyltransferase [Pseudobacillus badius]|uniref:GNAT family N-acetyltransferase n=1 Tax=Bacillus badius TaxID=1455 RepID=UPI0007B0B5E2|nr:GNAT family protein [Bacillus badius]KZO00869.1 GCN5 family acetyltransferase [Bacillus badius]OCS88799.1 GCN5 family acetyltransferase [Bacillus badius]OVE49605.1 N-acetyltransferase [Bacillus badius]TDW00985.1 RimJ/RimL family protein N-acetyltransferase [Bacillus badius]
MVCTDKEVMIRPIGERDMPRLWELMHKEEEPEWKQWDAPYFPHRRLTYEEFLTKKEEMVKQAHRWAIEVNEEVVGTVNYYWEHKPSKWLEMGIALYDPAYWNGGYGTRAFQLWINHLFEDMPLVRVGYTTWSGNGRMIKLGEKLGMKMEGRIRNVRYYNGEYFDSIRMGMLREEWEAAPWSP